MFEQFDDDIMRKALKRPFPVEDELPQAFRDLLGRFDQPADSARPGDGCAENRRASRRASEDGRSFARRAAERHACD